MARSIQEVKSRRRIAKLWPLLAFMYLALMGRVIVLQTIKAPDFRQHASRERKPKDIPAPRGRILDRNGKELAFNVDQCSVIVFPRMIGNKPLAAQILAKHLGLSQSGILHTLRTRAGYTVLATGMRVEVRSAIQKAIRKAGASAKINGVDYLITNKRIYPMGSICAKLVGYTNSVGTGLTGIEQYADDKLAGKPGSLVADFDGNGRPIPTRIRRRVEAIPGKDIVLTIDSRIQFAAQDALTKQVQATGAKSGSCIVMDPGTGELLAVAEYPTFDPNHVERVELDKMTSTSMLHIFEPGSTMKLVTAAGALRYGFENVSTVCSGKIPVASKIIECPCSVRKRGDNPANIQKMLQFSCNSESTALARRMGSERLYNELKLFGLFDRLEINGLGRTAGGMVPDPRKYDWPMLRLANVSFGQGVATTRMNLANAYAAVANGGTLLNPRLILDVKSEDGVSAQMSKPKVIRRVASKATCDTLKNYLKICVEDGTGRTAQIPGFIIGGKTGSAQMPKEGGRGFEPGAYCASFIGMAPLNDPKLVILVSVEKPKSSTHGATVAAPIFNKVAQKALWYLGRVATPGYDPTERTRTRERLRANRRLG